MKELIEKIRKRSVAFAKTHFPTVSNELQEAIAATWLNGYLIGNNEAFEQIQGLDDFMKEVVEECEMKIRLKRSMSDN